MKKKQRIHKDKHGREYIKQSYFVGGKMKFHRVYMIDGITAEAYYEQNASDIDHYLNGDYHLISYERERTDLSDESNIHKSDFTDNERDDLPF